MQHRHLDIVEHSAQQQNARLSSAQETPTKVDCISKAIKWPQQIKNNWILFVQNGFSYYSETLQTDPGVTGSLCHCGFLACSRELELWLSMPKFGEKERKYLFKSFTDLE